MVLVEISGRGALGDAFALEGETTIGRAPTCGICLRDHTASKVHARIVVEAGALVLTDLVSRNGTYVNGVRVAVRRLAPGDEVRVGATRWRVLEEAPSAPPPSLEPPARAPGAHASGARPAEEAVASVARGWEAAFEHLVAIEERASAAQDPIELMSALLDRLIRLLGGDRGAVVIVEEGSLAPVMRVDGGPEEGGTEDAVMADAATLRRSLEQRRPETLEGDANSGTRARHLAVFPLTFAGDAVGAALVEREARRGPYLEREVQVGRLAAALAAPAIRALLQAGGGT